MAEPKREKWGGRRRRRVRPDLSFTEARILRFLREFYDRRGYYATVRDIQKELGHKSPSTAHTMLVNLEEKGRVERILLTKNRYVYFPVER